MPTDLAHLSRLYAATDDPWNFRTSAYEAAKFAATADALPRPRYAHGLELGCGNGELARRLAPRCAAYTGLDAVEVAVAAARRAVPGARFVRGVLPDDLTDDLLGGDHDLVVLSELLYFLTPATLDTLARRIDSLWPGADVMAVTWCGPSGNALEGDDALDLYAAATPRARTPLPQCDDRYRIDTFAPLPAPLLGVRP